MMDPSTVHCAVILIYIRGQRPALNQETTSICYLNDKQRPQERRRERGLLAMRWTNQFRFQSRKDAGRGAIRLMKNGSHASPNGNRARLAVPPPIQAPSRHHPHPKPPPSHTPAVRRLAPPDAPLAPDFNAMER